MSGENGDVVYSADMDVCFYCTKGWMFANASLPLLLFVVEYRRVLCWASLRFALYMLPLGSIFDKYRMSCHFYADDIQIYFKLSDDLPAPLNHLSDCLKEVRVAVGQLSHFK